MGENPYTILYPEDFKKQLDYIDRKYWKLIKENIEKYLLFEPDIKTKNRKPLSKLPVDSIWEIRFGPKNIFRVFYKCYPELKEVWILSIGYKEKDKLFIMGDNIL